MTDDKETIACENCLLLAACRLKSYSDMIELCDHLYYELYTTRPLRPTSRCMDFDKRIYVLEKALNPVAWRVALLNGNVELLSRGV